MSVVVTDRCWLQPERLDRFLLHAGGAPADAPAVVELDEDGGVRTVSYGELRAQAASYGRDLDDLGLAVADRVVVESPNSAAAIAMLAACSSRGLTFVPVTSEVPAERCRRYVEATGASLYLRAAGCTRRDLPPTVGVASFDRTGVTVERAPSPTRSGRSAPSPTDPAYVIFTSGTTGAPKGVVMSHRGVIAFYRGMLGEGMVGPDDRVASTSALNFDFSLLDIGLALGHGAAVVPVPRDLLRWPRRFLSFLDLAEVTHVDGVPSIWRSSLRFEPERLAGMRRLRTILFCGEEFPMQELRRLQELLPAVRLVNCYGATESMACSFTDVPRPIPDDLAHLSIGFAHAGAEMLLVDPSLRPIDADGVPGEIVLRSPALFTGYWDDPEATAGALILDPVDSRSQQRVLRTGDLAYRGPGGELHFCGRVDSQVQVRGNRVELGEVEHALRRCDGVAAAAVIALREGDDVEPVVCAFVVAGDGSAGVDEPAVLERLRRSLPEYMLPHRITTVDELPLSGNGKVDRAKLASSLEPAGAR
jgi:amino acid adenylation domain-containing protein